MNASELKSVTIDGARASYREWGERQGPTVLCLHGNPTSSFMWRRLGEELKDSMRVLAPDLPGHGESELGGRAGTWEEMEEFVERFAATLEIGEFDLVVHDWGGLTGLRWLFDHSARLQNLRRLVVSDTAFFHEKNIAWHSLAQIWRTPGDGEVWMDALTFDIFREGMRAGGPNMAEEAFGEYWKTLATPERREARLALYRSGDLEILKQYDGRLATLECPSLILWGEDDPFLPVAAAHRFAEEIPNSELRIFTGVGHFLWDEKPEETAGLVREFLTGD